MTEAVAILSRTPATLDALLRGLPAGWTMAHEGGESWSPFDVIGHLIHGERTDWLPRARIILESGEAKAFDKFDRFAQFAASNGRTLDSLLDEFAVLRRANLRDLAALEIAESDLDHVIQVARVMGRQYSDAVGPWRAYLRVISGEQG